MKTCAQCHIKYPDVLEFCPQDGSTLPGIVGRTQALYDALIGTTVDGRYLIEAKLGEGGMGLVYAARHVLIDKRVAMKVLKTEAQEDPTAGPRFIQEAKSASKIRHPNIVDITDFGVLPDGSAYFVMEFLEGYTLGDVIRQGPIAAPRVISIAAQVARGLHAAHGKGIIHRDLKPDNVFLLEREGVADNVKIVDFGIAKIQDGGALGMAAGQRLTQAGMVLGTPEYMSPEQATGKETDHRVDEYALGCIMYEMLTSEVPYRGDNSAGTLTKHVFDPIVPPRRRRPDLAIPAALDAVVVKAMGKSADDRYPGMKQLLEALDQATIEIESGRDAQRAEQAAKEHARPTVMATLPPVRVRAQERDPVPERRRLPAILLGAGAALVLLGAGAWAVVRETPASEASGGPSVDAAGAVAMLAPPLAPPIIRSQVELTLRSFPDGADIYQDGEMVGQAPRTIALPIAATAVEFVFKKGGYEDRSEKLVPDHDRQLEVHLLPQIERKPVRAGHSSGSHRGKTPKKGTTTPSSELRNPFR